MPRRPAIALAVDRVDALAGKVEDLLFIALVLGELIVVKAPRIFPAADDTELFLERQRKQRMSLPPDLFDPGV